VEEKGGCEEWLFHNIKNGRGGLRLIMKNSQTPRNTPEDLPHLMTDREGGAESAWEGGSFLGKKKGG